MSSDNSKDEPYRPLPSVNLPSLNRIGNPGFSLSSIPPEIPATSEATSDTPTAQGIPAMSGATSDTPRALGIQATSGATSDTLTPQGQDFVAESQTQESLSTKCVSSITSEKPTERIKSWIQDLSTEDPQAPGTSSSYQPPDEKDKITKAKAKPEKILADMLPELKPLSPIEMSSQGRYMSLPVNKNALSKISLDIVARKLSQQVTKTSEGRNMGEGTSNQTLTSMIKHRRSSLPATSDSYVQLMNARTTSRAGSVISVASKASATVTQDQETEVSTLPSETGTASTLPKALNRGICNASGEFWMMQFSPTAVPVQGELVSSLIQKTLDIFRSSKHSSGLNFKTLANIRMLTKKTIDRANALEKFAQSPEHMRYVRRMSDHFSTSIPIPVQMKIYGKIVPILHDTCKAYKNILGVNHQLTKEAHDKYELFSLHLEEMQQTMG